MRDEELNEASRISDRVSLDLRGPRSGTTWPMLAVLALAVFLVVLIGIVVGFVFTMRWILRRPAGRPWRSRRVGENTDFGPLLSMIDGTWTPRRAQPGQTMDGGGDPETRGPNRA